MLHVRRLVAISIGCATWCTAAATVADAKGVPDPHPVLTSSAGTPMWEFLAYVALGVLVPVAIVGLGHSLSHSQRLDRQRSQPSQRSQPPMRA
jgi:hypothetical protein